MNYFIKTSIIYVIVWLITFLLGLYGYNKYGKHQGYGFTGYVLMPAFLWFAFYPVLLYLELISDD